MNTTESSHDRYKAFPAEHQAAKDALTGSASDRLDVTALEQVLNRCSKTGDQLMALKVNLAGIVEKLEGNAPGEIADPGRDRRDGLLGFANDQQDTIDRLVSDCTGLVSRLSGLI